MSNSIPLSSDDNNELNNISSDPQEDNFFVEQPSIIEPSLDEIYTNHFNENNTNAESINNNSLTFRLNSSRNDFIQYPSINLSALGPFSLNYFHLNNNYESRFIDEDEENDNFNYDYQMPLGNNIDEVNDNLGYILNIEKQKIKTEKEKIIEIKRNFNKFKKEYKSQYKKKKEIIKNLIENKENNKRENKNEKIIIDIGGKIQIISKALLLKYPNSVLGAIFNNHIKLPKRNGNIFIDRDPKIFSLMLFYLQNLSLPNFANEIEEKDFFDEISFWKIPIKQSKTQFKFNFKWCSPNLIIDKTQTIIKKNSTEHGIVFLKPKMNIFNSYIEFKIDISIPYKNKNHLYIGLVDETKYKKSYLQSTFWKDCPCSFYWDAWNGKLIKIDENGNQTFSKKNYGCDFEGNDIKYGILYNHFDRTVSFFRNDVNLGVAFHHVQPNLTPSIDIWFVNGKITIGKEKEPKVRIYL